MKIVNAEVRGVNVDLQGKRGGDPAGAGRNALGRLAKKNEEIRYLRRKSLQMGEGRGDRGRNLKVAATSRDGAECGRLMIGHI